jgi:hypothetical protein
MRSEYNLGDAHMHNHMKKVYSEYWSATLISAIAIFSTVSQHSDSQLRW